MPRPVWFRRRPGGWTPCAWQGWLASALCLLLSFAALYWGRWWEPVFCALGVFGPLGLLFVVILLTDDAAA
jgi:hypothetical protein